VTNVAIAANFDVKYDIDADKKAAIEACGGDIRAALRAALVANAFMEENLEKTLALVSMGFSRGKSWPCRASAEPKEKTG
jgi:hypothetical protein